jgi:hypothetical protein
MIQVLPLALRGAPAQRPCQVPPKEPPLHTVPHTATAGRPAQIELDLTKHGQTQNMGGF